MNQRLLIALVSWWTTSPLLAADALSLTIGESQDIVLPAMEVQLSRKGVVDLFHRKNGAWSVTGLKRGFVLLTSGSKQWKISVSDHQISDQAAEDPTCSLPGVTCSQDRVVVKGSFADPRTFFAAARVCASKRICEFTGTLTAAGKTVMDNTLQHSHSWELTTDRFVAIKIYCGRDQHKALPAWLPTRITCWRPQYRAKLRVEARTSQDGYRLGMQHVGRTDGQWSAVPTSPAGLIDQQTESHDSWQALPEFTVTAGETAELHAGGEIPVHHPETGTEWKPFGLQITLTVHPQGSAIDSTYSVGLSNRTAERSLAGSTISSTATIETGAEVHLASVPMQGASQAAHGSHLLHEIPLLGPWFRQWSVQNDTRTLQVYLQIDEQVAP